MSCSEDAMEVEASPPPPPSPSELLQKLTSGLSKLSVCSRAIPSREDFHYYRNFDEFKSPIEQITTQSHSMLDSIAAAAAAPLPTANDDDDDDAAYDWLVDVNDNVLERLDMSLDEFKRIRNEQEEEEGGEFQLVCGKKKKKKKETTTTTTTAAGASSSSSSGLVKSTTKPKVSFHVPSIRKPQEEFKILMNNSNQPFQHVWLETTDDGQRLVHPLEKLSVDDFIDNAAIGDLEPVKPPPIEATPFKLVEEVKDLKELAAKLRSVTEFAVDLEHNQYRSFQGMTCLMQISTRTEDFIVDTLKLRIHVGPYLREVFKDPLKRKVMHGADRDIVWLQRDFGIYVCNMFDTGQASRVLKLERNSLEFLLHHFCDVTANKEYQNADWRFRPLSKEMVRYAREDTHYLLYIYDLMRAKLSSMSKESEDSDAPLIEVYKRSYDICMHLYEKEMFTENSYLHIYGLQGACFNSQQLAVVSGLCQWRDVVARTEDESTGYILPNKTLLELAKQMPDTANKLKRLVKSKHPYIEQHLGSVVSVIKNSMQNSAFFEAAAEQLKMERMEMQSENNVMVSDGSGSHLVNGDASAISPASPTHKEESTECGCDASKGAEKVKSDNDVSVRSTHKMFKGQIGGESSLLQTSPKVTGATVQVQKKPSRAFSALLGSAVPKRKFDADVKVKEQITSSVNFPFHSFSGTIEQPNPKMGKPARGSEVPQPEMSVTVSPAKLNLEYVPVHQENDSVAPAVGMDEPSLSELSSSFKKCLPPLDQNRKAREVKHFDYEAAKKQVIFGEKQSKNVGAGEEGMRSLGSGAKKKSQADSSDGSKELAPGRSRQAFPASGNRSATFR